MPVLELTVELSQDGVLLPDYPIIRRLVVQETFPADLVLAASGNVSLPLGSMTTRQALVIRTLDQPVTAALGTVTLNAGGFIVIYDGLANATTVTNTSGTKTTEIQAVGAGAP